MGKVLVVGSFNLDLVVRTEKIPRPGETVLGGGFFTAHGGKGANQAVASARMGAQVSFVARVGKDSAGDAALKSLGEDAIDTRFISRDPKEPTGTAMIILSQEGENCIVVASGANHGLSVECVSSAFEEAAHCDVVLVQLETPLEGVAAMLGHAQALGKITILNPAPARTLPDAVLKSVSILTPNETEAEILTGVRVTDIEQAGKAAAILHARGVGTVIITLGEKGAFVSSLGEKAELIPTQKVTVVDTTAAGDVFSGALAAALSEKKPLAQAVKQALAAASLSVTRLGAQPSIPYWEEL
jgi:ribokinase